jgi:hypothetical protein
MVRSTDHRPRSDSVSPSRRNRADKLTLTIFPAGVSRSELERGAGQRNNVAEDWRLWHEAMVPIQHVLPVLAAKPLYRAHRDVAARSRAQYGAMLVIGFLNAASASKLCSALGGLSQKAR